MKPQPISGKTVFHYYKSGEDCRADDAERFIVRVPTDLANREELFSFYERELKFPYFGRNWDALNDVLGDLAWINADRIVIRHDGVPTQLDPESLSTYLRILTNNVLSWRASQKRELCVMFPVSCRDQVERRIKDYLSRRSATSALVPLNRTSCGIRTHIADDRLVVDYDYKEDNGRISNGKIIFENCVSFSFVEDAICPAANVLSPTTIRVLWKSEYLDGVRARMEEAIDRQQPQHPVDLLSYQHFTVYFDRVGSLDAIAIRCVVEDKSVA